MADTKRQDVIDALLIRLALILTASGYETNAGQNVYEWRPDSNELDASMLPSVCIYDTLDDWAPEAMGQHRYSHALTVIIEGVASGETSAATARKLIKDIHACIGSDRTLGGVIEWLEPKSDRLMRREANINVTACQVTFELRYTTINYGT